MIYLCLFGEICVDILDNVWYNSCGKVVKFFMRHFRFWCQHVLPLVYDDSLSYYEVLCKAVKYINDLIDQDKIIENELSQLEQDLAEVQDWIDKFDYDKINSMISEIIQSFLATMIFVEVNSDGYIVYFIPEKWEDIMFNTTGLDIVIPGWEYGRLVLSY